MFWIEESPTNAADDDSDVPFDESPGKPMACEQEIELVIKPDDDLYPFKSLDADDADTWPETLTNTHDGYSDDDDKDGDHSSSTNNKDDSNDTTSTTNGAAAAAVDDDDATQVMGEHHTIEGGFVVGV